MKTICPPSYYHNGFVAIHALCTWAHDVGLNQSCTTCVQANELPLGH